MSESSKAVRSVLARLDVVERERDVFVGSSTQLGPPRLFGGQVAGQAVVAAARSVEPGLSLHSLHAYFLAPGRPGEDVRYEVRRVKEGRNFHARQVIGGQGERVIFSMQASFTRAATGVSHQDAMPDAPPPDSIEPRQGFWGGLSPVEMRDCDGSFERAAENGCRRLWMRPSAELPEDPALHLGMYVFASDMSLVMTGVLPHADLRKRPRGGASLDHAMWFHRLGPWNDWILYTMQTPAAHAGRPLITGAMYRRDGTRLASVAQEGLLR
jgi:acyl-CoA thioesterase-2